VSLLMFPCNFPRRSASQGRFRLPASRGTRLYLYIARFADAIRSCLFVFLVFFSGAFQAASAECLTRGTGDLGIVIERASGSVQILDTTEKVSLFRVEGLGDLSHASAVFSRDGRYAYVFGRDGGLSRIDLLCGKLDKRVVQAGNSIGGAISQDGSLVAVSNYTPGGIKVFAADSLELLTDLPALDASGTPSKVVGLVDAPGQRFVYTLYDAGEIRIADLSTPAAPQVQKFPGIGRLPYDALITPDGRYYIAGLFGEDGMALLDLWKPITAAARRNCRSTRCRTWKVGRWPGAMSFCRQWASTRCWSWTARPGRKSDESPCTGSRSSSWRDRTAARSGSILRTR
jgi:hypothetical protein